MFASLDNEPIVTKMSKKRYHVIHQAIQDHKEIVKNLYYTGLQNDEKLLEPALNTARKRIFTNEQIAEISGIGQYSSNLEHNLLNSDEIDRLNVKFGKYKKLTVKKVHHQERGDQPQECNNNKSCLILPKFNFERTVTNRGLQLRGKSSTRMTLHNELRQKMTVNSECTTLKHNSHIDTLDPIIRGQLKQYPRNYCVNKTKSYKSCLELMSENDKGSVLVNESSNMLLKKDVTSNKHVFKSNLRMNSCEMQIRDFSKQLNRVNFDTREKERGESKLRNTLKKVEGKDTVYEQSKAKESKEFNINKRSKFGHSRNYWKGQKNHKLLQSEEISELLTKLRSVIQKSETDLDLKLYSGYQDQKKCQISVYKNLVDGLKDLLNYSMILHNTILQFKSTDSVIEYANETVDSLEDKYDKVSIHSQRKMYDFQESVIVVSHQVFVSLTVRPLATLLVENQQILSDDNLLCSEGVAAASEYFNNVNGNYSMDKRRNMQTHSLMRTCKNVVPNSIDNDHHKFSEIEFVYTNIYDPSSVLWNFPFEDSWDEISDTERSGPSNETLATKDYNTHPSSDADMCDTSQELCGSELDDEGSMSELDEVNILHDNLFSDNEVPPKLTQDIYSEVEPLAYLAGSNDGCWRGSEKPPPTAMLVHTHTNKNINSASTSINPGLVRNTKPLTKNQHSPSLHHIKEMYNCIKCYRSTEEFRCQGDLKYLLQLAKKGLVALAVTWQVNWNLCIRIKYPRYFHTVQIIGNKSTTFSTIDDVLMKENIAQAEYYAEPIVIPNYLEWTLQFQLSWRLTLEVKDILPEQCSNRLQAADSVYKQDKVVIYHSTWARILIDLSRTRTRTRTRTKTRTELQQF